PGLTRAYVWPPEPRARHRRTAPSVRGPRPRSRRDRSSLGRAVHVAVNDLYEVVPGFAIPAHEMLGDRNRTVTAARAPDRDHQVSLSLREVLRQQVVEQRKQPLVERVELPIAVD